MALNLYYSNTFRGAFDSLCNSLKGNLNGEQSNIVIVPDRFSLTIEKAILDKLQIDGSMNIEVVSFSRLAALLLGNRISKCLSPESAVMLLSKVIRENRDNLQCYRGVKDITAFSRDMFAAISEIRNNNISVTMLKSAKDNIKNVGIDKKTNDIILLYEKYLNELTLKYNDSTTRLEKLIEEIPDNIKIHNSHIYITDFYSFKNTEYNIIEALIRSSLSVNIALIHKPNNHNNNSRIYPHYKLKTIADKLNYEVSEHYSEYKLNPVNKVIEARLFAYDTNRAVDCNGKIKLYCANDIESELIAVARRIKELIREGRRYLDIAIVCGDIETYTPYVESIFKRFHIPVFVDRKELLANHPLVRYIFSVFDFINNDYPINYAYEIIKNPFFKVSSEASDVFENYCIKYGIKGRKLFYPFTQADKDNYVYTLAESVRVRLINTIRVINSSSECSVSDYIKQIEDLCNVSECDATMAELARSQFDIDDRASAEVTRQIPQKLSEIFAEIIEMLGQQKLCFDEFVTLIKTSLSYAKIAMIPQYIDCVFIGEPLESRYAVIKDLFVIGASDNVMPVNRKDKGIITSYECNEWKLEIFPSARQSSSLDKFYLHQLLIKPESSQTFSYCSRSIDGEFSNPSIIIKQLERMFNLTIESVNELYNDNDYAMSDIDRATLYGNRFGTYDNALKELVGALRSIKAANVIDNRMLPYDAVYQLLEEDRKAHILEINNQYKDVKPYVSNAELLFFKKRASTSVSQLESYFKCPFIHFAQYGIRAMEREEATVEANVRGDIIHLALELFVRYVMRDYPDYNISNEVRDTIIEGVIIDIMSMDKYKPKLDNNIIELLSDSIRRTLIYVFDIINTSKFKPYLVEAVFEDDKQFPCIPIVYGNNKVVNLRGKIDRVDRYRDNIIVVDYKTGVVEDLRDDLYYGVKIQLFIYLRALTGNNLKPAGALYMQLKDDFTKSKDIKYAYIGRILQDSIDDFDPTNNSSCRLIKAKLSNEDKDGNSAISEELMNNMIRYSTEIASKAANEIAEGYIESKVHNTTCKYCNYIDICHSRMTSPIYRKCGSRRGERFEIGGKICQD